MLPAREAAIIRQRHMSDAAPTFEAIGRELGISRTRQAVGKAGADASAGNARSPLRGQAHGTCWGLISSAGAPAPGPFGSGYRPATAGGDGLGPRVPRPTSQRRWRSRTTTGFHYRPSELRGRLGRAVETRRVLSKPRRGLGRARSELCRCRHRSRARSSVADSRKPPETSRPQPGAAFRSAETSAGPPAGAAVTAWIRPSSSIQRPARPHPSRFSQKRRSSSMTTRSGTATVMPRTNRGAETSAWRAQ